MCDGSVYCTLLVFHNVRRAFAILYQNKGLLNNVPFCEFRLTFPACIP